MFGLPKARVTLASFDHAATDLESTQVRFATHRWFGFSLTTSECAPGVQRRPW